MLRVWTKLYDAFNTGQISVLGSAMWGCGEQERQKLNKLISSFLSSPLLRSSPSHLLSFPHISSHLSAHLLFRKSHRILHPSPSFVLTPHHFLTLVSCLIPALPPITAHLFSTSHFLVCLCSLHICIHIQNGNNFGLLSGNIIVVRTKTQSPVSSSRGWMENNVCVHFCQF